MDFADFDNRHYPTVSVRQGYRKWVSTYDDSVYDEMDLDLLAKIKKIYWTKMAKAVDLACGTGRTGAWLKRQGIRELDGIDITPEMMDNAKEKKIYRQLVHGDIRNTKFADNTYDLAVCSLANEHIPSLDPLYKEADRIVVKNGYFVIVGYHPFFLLNGIPTHFNDEEGKSISIHSYIHLMSDHVQAAFKNSWQLQEMYERIVDQEWLKKKPQWEIYCNKPISFIFVWQKK
ncbi:class I SAM-dependent methyltransferase [Candidatus Uabimicrobium sp. HlEnr_7]|uniref:class I SAM-dependent DNA methyltransferase n=1 Tax=Candidatus Uabimicrobium helgolandensis TaxID=3095367 RepID=UPI003558AE7A